MQPGRRLSIAFAGALGFAPFAARLAARARYPGGPIRIIAPEQPGGGAGSLATFAQRRP